MRLLTFVNGPEIDPKTPFMTKRMNIPKGNQDVEVTPWENVLVIGWKDAKEFELCEEEEA